MNRAGIFILSLALAAPLVAQGPSQTTTPSSSDPAPVDWLEPGPMLFGDPAPNGEVHLGLQGFDTDTESSKIEEYREIPEGFNLPFFRLYGRGALRYHILGKDLGEDDQHLFAEIDGSWLGLELDYTEIPHRLGNDGVSILHRTSRSSWEMSDTLQRAHQSAIEAQRTVSPASVNYAFLNNLLAPTIAAGEHVDLGVQRDRGLVELSVKNLPLDVRLTYFQENRSGTRDFGTAFGFGNVVETPETRDYETRDVGIHAEMPVGRGLIRGSINVNDFKNAVSAFYFDNPFRGFDSTDPNAYQAPAAASINGPVRGAMALPPDNEALTAALGFHYKVGATGRLTADWSMGTWEQNEAFLPFTTNTAITTPFDFSDPSNLPARSLDGEINTFNQTYSFNWRPLAGLGVNARLNMYELDDQTDRIRFENGYVRFDAARNATRRISVPYSHERMRGDVTVSYDFSSLLSLEAGWRMEQMERTFRETEETDENVLRLGADGRWGWMQFHAAHEFGDRDYDHYDPEHSEHASFLDAGPPANLLLLRRFDQAKRDLDRIVATVQLTPFDPFVLAINYVTQDEDYNQTDYGLIDAESSALSIDADYSPGDRWSLFGFYTMDEWSTFQRGRQSGGTLSANPLDDWTAAIDMEGTTFGAGANFYLVPDKVTLTLQGRMHEVDAYNDVFSPPGGTPDVGVDIPRWDDTSLTTLAAELAYRMTEAWELGVGGWIEDYEIEDPATQGLLHYMPGAYFLAPNHHDYSGSSLWVRAGYRF